MLPGARVRGNEQNGLRVSVWGNNYGACNQCHWIMYLIMAQIQVLYYMHFTANIWIYEKKV